MNAGNLKRQKQTWYARATVPAHLRSIVGKSEVLRTLKTRDLVEANKRKHSVLATLHAEWAALAAPSVSPEDARRFVADARQLLAYVKDGSMTADDAYASFDADIDKFLDARAEVVGLDEDGHAAIPAAEANAIRTAFRIPDVGPTM